MARKVYYVTSVGDVWGVRRARRKRVDGIHVLKADAIEHAKKARESCTARTGESSGTRWAHSDRIHLREGSAGSRNNPLSRSSKSSSADQ